MLVPDNTVTTIILPISYNKYIMLTYNILTKEEIFSIEELNTLLSQNSFDFFIHRYGIDLSEYKKYIGTNNDLLDIFNYL